MKRIVKILKISIIVILAIILILNISIMIQSKIHPDQVPSVFGYKPFVVTSGSMESSINIGDLVFVKNVNYDELKVNDIIAFKGKDDIVTTHRIVEEVEVDNEKCFKTKGDNNNTIDYEVVCKEKVEGIYSGKIAKVGEFILFIQKPLGFIVMMLTILIICILIYFISNRNANKLDEEELKEFEEFKKAKREKQEQEENNVKEDIKETKKTVKKSKKTKK